MHEREIRERAAKYTKRTVANCKWVKKDIDFNMYECDGFKTEYKRHYYIRSIFDWKGYNSWRYPDEPKYEFI